MEQTVDWARVGAEIKGAEIVLTPNPDLVEDISTVERIWGKEIVFSGVPLKRLDLGGTEPPK